MKFSIRFLEGEYCIAKLKNPPVEFPPCGFCTYAQTHSELSLACLYKYAPKTADKIERDYCLFFIEGVLDFSLTGVLAGILDALRDAGIPVLAFSTFDTDYIMIKQSEVNNALRILLDNGYAINQNYVPAGVKN